MASCGGAFGPSLDIEGGKSNREFAMAIDEGGILAEFRNSPYWRDITITYHPITGAVKGCVWGPPHVGAGIARGAVFHYNICSTKLGTGMALHGYAIDGKYVPGPFGTPGHWKYRYTKAWVTCHKGL